MIAQVNGRAEFIQFAQRSEKGSRGIKSDFPIADWSARYESRLLAVLAEEGFEFGITEVDRPQPKGVQRFVSLSFHQDIAEAARYAQTVFERVVGLAPNTEVQVHFENIGPDDEWLAARMADARKAEDAGR